MSAMALEAQTEAENLMWVTRTTSNDDVEHASCSSGPEQSEATLPKSSKRKQAKAKRQTQRRGGIADKGGRVVKKYAVNFEGRRLQVCLLEMPPPAVTFRSCVRLFVRSVFGLLTFF